MLPRLSFGVTMLDAARYRYNSSGNTELGFFRAGEKCLYGTDSLRGVRGWVHDLADQDHVTKL